MLFITKKESIRGDVQTLTSILLLSDVTAKCRRRLCYWRFGDPYFLHLERKRCQHWSLHVPGAVLWCRYREHINNYVSYTVLIIHSFRELILCKSRCGYEVPGIILLEPYLYTYSLLRGVTFKILPLDSYTLSPTMLPLLETFLQLLLWNRFQCRRQIFSWMSSVSWNLRPFKVDFIFENSLKSFGVKTVEHGRCSISVIGFRAINCSTESASWAVALSWCRIQSLGQRSGLFHCLSV
jgi:hypothetical protein